MQIIVFLFLVVTVVWVVAALFLCGPDHSQYDDPEPVLHRDPGTVSADNAEVKKLINVMFSELRGVSLLRRIYRLRELFDEGFTGSPMTADGLGVQITGTEAGGVAAEWVVAPGASGARRLLYIHGGAFAIGSPTSHRMITAALSKACGVSVLAIDYRLFPEHFRRAAIADCKAAYRYLLENGPSGPGDAQDVYVAGDSAGGNLSLMLSAWASENQLPTMDAVVAFSPSTDSTLSNPSARRNIATDPLLGPGLGPLARLPRPLRALLSSLMGMLNASSVAMSPLFGELRNLPPTLVFASDCEMLLDDSLRYVNKARAQGSPVRLQLWPGMVHVWQMFQHVLPEARESIDEAAAFIAAHSSASQAGSNPQTVAGSS
ncbi:MAG: alpha/beta hydrolase [Woeseiaceae bacterium]|nr:alpha/beta hydrolase [Woeseiaceae bacterium]